jgi:hypothetical protein
MKPSDQELYNELSFYTLAHPDTIYFIHQHCVDAYTAQHADSNTKPISITFSLVGLYLFLEKKYTGKQVQQAHMHMARNKKAWPSFTFPKKRGDISIADVISALPGEARDIMIKKWCASVWGSYKDNHEIIAALVETYFPGL